MSTPKSERNADIVRRYRAGEGLGEIGQLHGITRQRVEQIARREGCLKRPAPTKAPVSRKVGRLGRVALEARNQEILALWNSGVTVHQIALALNMKRGLIDGVVRRHGQRRAELRRQA